MKTSRTAKAAAITPFVTEVVHTRQTTADGYYEVTIYPILPGILLAFNDVHTTTVPTAASHFFDDCLILNYCLDGRCEFCVTNDNYGYADSGMSSMAARMAQRDFYYPSGLYTGYEIYIFPPLFTGETEKTLALFGLDLRALRRRCQRSSAYATPRELQLIWEELYHSEGAAPLGTVRLQVLRALHYLDTHALPPQSGCARTIIRIYEPSEGKIILDGQDIAHMKQRQLQPIRRKMQMIFQDPYASLNARMTVHDIIAEPLKAHHVCQSRKDMDDKIFAMLERVGLTAEHAGRYAHEFSGGQRQRVGIARALVLNPELVICDEPISALDVSIQAQVVNLLRDYQQAEGTSYLFIAHDLSMVRYVSDDVGVMYLGQLVETCEAEEIYDHPLHPYTKGLLSCIPIADPKLARAQDNPGIEGDLPSPVNPKPGCRFCTRCPYAKPICHEQNPALKEAAPGHFVACHLY